MCQVMTKGAETMSTQEATTDRVRPLARLVAGSRKIARLGAIPATGIA